MSNIEIQLKPVDAVAAGPQDPSILAPLFMSIYGPVDLVFFLAFARQGLVAKDGSKRKKR